MITLIVRVSIIIIVLLLVMRLMGKKTLGEMQPFEFVITLVVSELACIPMSDPAIPLSYGLVPIFVILILHYLFALISRKSFRFRRILDGSHVIVISSEGVEYKALARLNMNIDDLIEATTTQGYFNLADIATAYFQTNGSLTIIPTPEASPLTCGNLGLQVAPTSYAVPFVEDGKLCNLDKLGRTEEELKEVLTHFPCRLKEIVLATADEAGNVYLKPRNGKFMQAKLDVLARTPGGAS